MTSLFKEDVQTVEDAIRAMEAWKTDLAWFLFQLKGHSQTGNEAKEKQQHHSQAWLPEELERFNARECLGGKLTFATLEVA